jgi:hypothetical protein
MDQPQAETIHIKDQLIVEKMPNRGRIRIAIDRPDLFPVENIQNGKIGQITGVQYEVSVTEGPLQNPSEFFVITLEMSI